MKLYKKIKNIISNLWRIFITSKIGNTPINSILCLSVFKKSQKSVQSMTHLKLKETSILSHHLPDEKVA